MKKIIEALPAEIPVGSVYPPRLWSVKGWKCPLCKKEWLEESYGGVNVCHCGFDRRKKYYLEEIE